jgi:hypothetical protein
MVINRGGFPNATVSVLTEAVIRPPRLITINRDNSSEAIEENRLGKAFLPASVKIHVVLT